MSAIWETIAAEASAESSLWAAALLPEDERELLPIFSPLGEPRFALGIETIYEGYLLHYGRSRLFRAADPDTALLLGDYLYSHGLVRISDHEHAAATADLAELISLCAYLRGEGVDGDAAGWAATAAVLGTGALNGARDALRTHQDPQPLLRLAERSAGKEAVVEALAAHGRFVRPVR